jgi:hypothetical protein
MLHVQIGPANAAMLRRLISLLVSLLVLLGGW